LALNAQLDLNVCFRQRFPTAKLESNGATKANRRSVLARRNRVMRRRAFLGMRRPRPDPKTPVDAPSGSGDEAHAASPAEEMARAAPADALTEAEKARLAAEVSRIEDA
jgi:hypothetical protein